MLIKNKRGKAKQNIYIHTRKQRSNKWKQIKRYFFEYLLWTDLHFSYAKHLIAFVHISLLFFRSGGNPHYIYDIPREERTVYLATMQVPKAIIDAFQIVDIHVV